MLFLRSRLTRHVRHVAASRHASTRPTFASRTPSPPFPVIATCPSPTCQCSSTPPGLDIDRSRDLNGSMSPYAQHVLVSSGRMDWTSKIEDERDTASWGRFTAEMKSLLGRGSEFHDPYNNILLSTSSFTPFEQVEGRPSEKAAHAERSLFNTKVDALLFPAFKHVKSLPSSTSKSDLAGLETFTRAFLLPERLHPIYNDISEVERRSKTRDTSHLSTVPIVVDPVHTVTILICSHGQRDSRCGILGPLLQSEFQGYIDNRISTSNERRFVAQTREFLSNHSDTSSEEPSSTTINVGTISHIGGHKWAGNVIIYIPPNTSTVDGETHPLAGKGIWYGRVEPKHVEGIVEETVLNGRVIRDLFRGGIGEDGSVVRL